MNKLPQVLLVLTVLGLGVMYGYYDFRVERGYHGSFLALAGETLGQVGKQPEVKLYPPHRAVLERDKTARASVKASGDAPEEKHPKVQKTLGEGGYAEQVTRPEHKERETPKRHIPPHQAELDEADRVIMAASTYRRLAVMNEEKRQEYAGKILDGTEDVLESLDELNQKFPNQPEIEERLSEILRLRQFAATELGAR
jgi:hypothetical protein